MLFVGNNGYVIRAVLFDLDGVVRHFSADIVAEIERRHGLRPGSLEAADFAQPVLTHVTTGQMSRHEWIAHIGATLGAPQAGLDWGSQTPVVDSEVLEVVRDLRRVGMTVAILTNGTDTIPEEVTVQGIVGDFDAIYNSAEIGYIKPDPRAFQYVLDKLGLSGAEVFFTDDSESKLSGARELGLTVHRYRGVASLRVALNDVGVWVDGNQGNPPR